MGILLSSGYALPQLKGFLVVVVVTIVAIVFVVDIIGMAC